MHRPVRYFWPMFFRKVARATLAVLLAYALILGSVLGGMTAHAAGADGMCTPSRAAGEPPASLPQEPGRHDADCCQGICGSQPIAEAPSAAFAAPIRFFDPVEVFIPNAARAPAVASWTSPRAPPAS